MKRLLLVLAAVLVAYPLFATAYQVTTSTGGADTVDYVSGDSLAEVLPSVQLEGVENLSIDTMIPVETRQISEEIRVDADGSVWTVTATETRWELPPNNLVGHWQFDEGGGLTAVDVSGKGRHGTIETAARIPGRTGGALDFRNGGKVDTKKWDVSGDEMSISAWVYLAE